MSENGSMDAGRITITYSVRCSFCGRPRVSVRKMVECHGTENRICEQCVEECRELMEEPKKRAVPEPDAWVHPVVLQHVKKHGSTGPFYGRKPDSECVPVFLMPPPPDEEAIGRAWAESGDQVAELSEAIMQAAIESEDPRAFLKEWLDAKPNFALAPEQHPSRPSVDPRSPE